MAKRKYTRKQLRQPDDFISFWSKVVDVARENLPRVIITLVIAILIVAGVWIWSYFAEKRASSGTASISRAFEVYNQSIFPMETKLPAAEDGIPRFKTHKARLEASEKEFTKTMETASGSLRHLAQLMRAGVRYEMGKYDKAIEDYRGYLAAGDDPELRYNASEAIGYCYEKRKELDKALEAFRKLPRDGARKWNAMYHEARVLALKGKKQEAIKVLKDVVENAKSPSLQERAGDQLALVEKGK